MYRLKPLTIFDLFACKKEKVYFYRILFDDVYSLNGRGKLRQVFPPSRSILDCKTCFSRTTSYIIRTMLWCVSFTRRINF